MQKISTPSGNRTIVVRVSAIRLNHRAIDSYQVRKNTVDESSFLGTWNCFFACRIVVLGLLRLNINAKHHIREFLNAMIDTSYRVRSGLKKLHFSLSSQLFCSMLIEQLIDLEKVPARTENLKFRTDLQDRVMDGWSVTQ